ncbi:MAG: hypothetical protein HZB91_05890 [Elusimicrobia bacterium]|nr:hypothetical protein [Elusimicrobiota bacterium]
MKPLRPVKTIEISTQEGGHARIHIYGRGIVIERGEESRAYLAGVRVPDWLIQKQPEDIDPAEFFRLKSPEVRSRFLSVLGVKRVLKSLSGKVLERTSRHDLIVFTNAGRRRPYLRDKTADDEWQLEELDTAIKTIEEALAWMQRRLDNAKRQERKCRGIR